MHRSADVRILPLGDAALTVEFGDRIDPAINRRVRMLHDSLLQNPILGVVESVPTYRALMVQYRPEQITWDKIVDALYGRLAAADGQSEHDVGEAIEIPVLYGGQWGPDLSFVAQHSGLDEAEVIRIHSEAVYHIYMLGFSPGFPYLGGMDERIAAPRLETPRVAVPAGAVGIAGKQTGIYSLSTPGGWRIIGRTPLRLYAPRRQQPILLQAGQPLRFRSIHEEEFHALCAKEADDGLSH